MARGRTDQEVLCISRASKLLEELDDPRAQARVASYLYMRFTSAGELILQSEDRALYNEDKRQIPLPFVATPAPTLPPTAPAPATPQGASAPASTQPAASSAGTAPGTPAAPKSLKDAPFFLGGGPGWDASGKGSEHDDDPTPKAPPKPPTTQRAKPNASGGWDLNEEEVEVKI